MLLTETFGVVTLYYNEARTRGPLLLRFSTTQLYVMYKP
jgi:hypothetical protein